MRIEDIVKLTKRYERLEQVSQSLEKNLNRLGEKTKENSEWIKNVYLVVSDGKYEGEEISFGGLDDIIALPQITDFVSTILTMTKSEMQEIKKQLENQ